MRLFQTFVLMCVVATAAEAQDRRDWQSLAQLNAGDKIRLTLKTGPVEGVFQSWTPLQVTAGTVTAKREEVLKMERYRQAGRGRVEHAAIGALIGFGGGFAIGAGVDSSCHQGEFLCPHISRGVAGAWVGGAGSIVGAAIGALLPRHNKELIYSVK